MSIYAGALAATTLSGAVYGYFFIKYAAMRDRSTVIVAALMTALIALPVVIFALSPLAFWLDTQLFDTLFLLKFAYSVQVPLIEEAAKWSILFLPWIRRSLRTDNVVSIALGIGFGFAVAEYWAQAHDRSGTENLEQQAALYLLLAWPFKGVVSPLIHGGFVFFVACRLATGRPVWPGALLGIGLHLIANLGTFTPFTGEVLGGAQPIFVVFATLASLAAMLMVGVVIIKASGFNLRETILGKPVVCPSCEKTYDRPWTGFNLMVISYEQCPLCRTKQWVRRAQATQSVNTSQPELRE